MIARRWRWRHAAAAAAVGVALLGGLGLANAAADTDAAWTDSVYATASVASGTWGPQLGCVWYVGSTPQQGATCTITSGEYFQYASNGAVFRNYYLTLSVVGGQQAGYARITADLSSYPAQSGSSGVWPNWNNAATLGGQVTPVAGFQCSELPILRANGPANGYAGGGMYYFQIISNKNVPAAAGKTCA